MYKVNSICIDIVHKITFLSLFRSDVHTCTKSYVTSEQYPRASQIWCQNVRETRKKIVIKCRGESFARCRVIARNFEGGPWWPPPPPPPRLIRVKRLVTSRDASGRFKKNLELVRILSISTISANGQGSRNNTLKEVQRAVPLKLVGFWALGKNFQEFYTPIFFFLKSSQSKK